MPTQTELKQLLQFAQQLVRDTGVLLLTQQKKAQILGYKDRQDVYTSADIASEALSIQTISERYSDHGITSEEQGSLRPESDFQWIIDPLDGTKEYIRGLPLYNSSMVLEYKGEPIVSAVYRPTDQTLYSAAKGVGAFRETEPISISKTAKLSDAFVYSYLPAYKGDDTSYDQAWSALANAGKVAYRVRALSDENTGMCWLAQGGSEAYINVSHAASSKWHDVAPGILIAKEAGATITDTTGKPISKSNREHLIVTNGFIHEQLLAIINTALHRNVKEGTL